MRHLIGQTRTWNGGNTVGIFVTLSKQYRMREVQLQEDRVRTQPVCVYLLSPSLHDLANSYIP
jgi:hypothetical protein